MRNIGFECLECGQVLTPNEIDQAWKGGEVKCPFCGSVDIDLA